MAFQVRQHREQRRIDRDGSRIDERGLAGKALQQRIAIRELRVAGNVDVEEPIEACEQFGKGDAGEQHRMTA